MKLEALQAELHKAGITTSRRDLMKLAAAGSAAFALGSAITPRGAAAQDATPVDGGIWRMAITATPTAYPITAPGALVDLLVNKTIYSNLVKYQLVDGQFQVVPDLAESWEASDDLTQYTFTLKEGVTWHDGEALTADDVKFTFDTILDPNVNASMRGPVSSIESVEVVDPRTVVFHLSRSFAPLPVMLGYNQAIVPKHLLEGQDVNQPTEFLQNPIGSGPFRFKELSQGNYLETERYEDYFDGRAHLDGMVFQIIADGNARVAQVRSGDIDFTTIEPPQVDTIKGDDNLELIEAPQVSYYFLAVNHTLPRLQDPKVRQALMYALNRQAIVDTVLKGYGQVATGPIHPSLGDYYTDQVTQYGYDPETSASLLAEAGWTKGDDGILVNEAGEKFTILLNGPKGYPLLEQLLTYAQQEFANLGIEVTLEIPEWSVHLDKYHKLEYDLLIQWWTTPPDPDLYDHHFSTSGNNWWAYNNPEVDELLVEARSEPDHAKRVELVHQLETIFADDLPVLYLYYQPELQARSKRTQGFPAMGYRDALTWSKDIWIQE